MKLAAENAMFYRRNCKQFVICAEVISALFYFKNFIPVRENLKVVFITVLLAL